MRVVGSRSRRHRFLLPGPLEHEPGRLHLVPLVGVQHPEGVRRRRGDTRGTGRRRRRGGRLGRVPVPVEGLPGRAAGVRRRRPPSPCSDLEGVAVQAQQQADLVPGGVLGVRGGVGGEAVDRASALYGWPAVTRGRPVTASHSRSCAAAASGRRSALAAAGVSGTSLASTATLSATAWKREEPRAWRAAEWARVRARVELAFQQGARFGRADGQAARSRCSPVRLRWTAAEEARRARRPARPTPPTAGSVPPAGAPAGPRTRAHVPGCRTARPVRGAGPRTSRRRAAGGRCAGCR